MIRDEREDRSATSRTACWNSGSPGLRFSKPLMKAFKSVCDGLIMDSPLRRAVAAGAAEMVACPDSATNYLRCRHSSLGYVSPILYENRERDQVSHPKRLTVHESVSTPDEGSRGQGETVMIS